VSSIDTKEVIQLPKHRPSMLFYIS